MDRKGRNYIYVDNDNYTAAESSRIFDFIRS